MTARERELTWQYILQIASGKTLTILKEALEEFTPGTAPSDDMGVHC
jgi:hypothetical protein